jgi:hypothetical protein
MNLSPRAAFIPAATKVLPNGSGAAAILSAGIGSFMIGVLAIAGDKSAFLKRLFNFYKPTGPLSGVTTVAIVVWLIMWGVLEWRWRRRTVAMGHTVAVALVLLGLGLLLTFPPIAEIF